jgi:hypothetical protein
MELKGQNQTQRSNVHSNGLERLINQSHLEALAAALVGIEISQRDKKFAERLAEKLETKFAFLHEGNTPGNAAQKHGLDLEMDLLPALQWLRFRDGFKAAQIERGGDEL